MELLMYPILNFYGGIWISEDVLFLDDFGWIEDLFDNNTNFLSITKAQKSSKDY